MSWIYVLNFSQSGRKDREYFYREYEIGNEFHYDHLNRILNNVISNITHSANEMWYMDSYYFVSNEFEILLSNWAGSVPDCSVENWPLPPLKQPSFATHASGGNPLYVNTYICHYTQFGFIVKDSWIIPWKEVNYKFFHLYILIQIDILSIRRWMYLFKREWKALFDHVFQNI